MSPCKIKIITGNNKFTCGEKEKEKETKKKQTNNRGGKKDDASFLYSYPFYTYVLYI